jgi:hypothetical protein
VAQYAYQSISSSKFPFFKAVVYREGRSHFSENVIVSRMGVEPIAIAMPETTPDKPTDLPTPPEKILCPHCQRTATNGIKCQGICVADSDY